MRHVRHSERKVREEIYETLADLKGLGLSISEACHALVKVANSLFGRSWKVAGEDGTVYDIDTLPDTRNVRYVDELIEAKSLACIADKLEEEVTAGRMITHAMDSTTKKGVGKFAVAGIHIGQNVPFPLPLIKVEGERTKDIADQIILMFDILAIVKQKPASEIYQQVHAHMTDSVEHNKGFPKIIKEIYDLDTEAGQLFCGTHTTLGFSSAMNKQIAVIERKMTLEAIIGNFMIDLDFASKHVSVVGQAVDCMLRLVAPEYNHKSWNYHGAFVAYLKNQGASQVLFAYKDRRFGCLSRASGVLVYLLPYLEDFLNKNADITNKLACIVRSFLDVEYIRPVLVVFTALGIHLIEPFFSKTISTDATHSSLKVFYHGLYNQMGINVNEDFFDLERPWFPNIDDQLFASVKKGYGESVVNAMISAAQKYEKEVISICNFVMPELRTTLARQRRDYGISDEFPAQYPVAEQAPNVDDTPTSNMAMERLCGKVDNRLHKLKQLEAVSKSIIFQQTESLRQNSSVSFRSFVKEAAEIKEHKLTGAENMKVRFALGRCEKEAMGMEKERKKYDMLSVLKKQGGPFTSAEEVDAYLNSALDDEMKQKRLKMEMRFARESSTNLPKSDPIFRIQVTLPNKKRRDKTFHEFAISLKALLGKKKGAEGNLTLDRFRESLALVIGGQ